MFILLCITTDGVYLPVPWHSTTQDNPASSNISNFISPPNWTTFPSDARRTIRTASWLILVLRLSHTWTENSSFDSASFRSAWSLYWKPKWLNKLSTSNRIHGPYFLLRLWSPSAMNNYRISVRKRPRPRWLICGGEAEGRSFLTHVAKSPQHGEKVEVSRAKATQEGRLHILEGRH